MATSKVSFPLAGSNRVTWSIAPNYRPGRLCYLVTLLRWLLYNKVFKAWECGAWECLRSKQQRVDWSRRVWLANSIPRHSFVTWIVLLDRLSTRSRQKKWSAQINDI
ncbi:hypothetical protein SLA2020_229070 [Shorea laevis]